jgi:hypothetical protein
MRFSIRAFLILCISLLLGGGRGVTSEIADLDAGKGYIHPTGTFNSRLTSNDIGPIMLAEDLPVSFHYGPTLLCSQCHVMHTSQQHPHDNHTLPDPFGPFPQYFTPTEKLLKAADPVALCLTCHDNVAGIPDVVGADANGLVERSAGYFESPNINNPRGHKLEYGLESGSGWELCMRCHFEGTFPTASVSCVDCHNPHGNGRPRNLQWASNPGGEPQFGLFVRPGVSGMARYEKGNVGYGTTNNAELREVTNMCLDCHHVFSGGNYIDPEGDGIHNRHPSYESERNSPNNIDQGAVKGSTDPGHWEDGSGAGFLVSDRLRYVNNGAEDFATSHIIDAEINGVFCLSCHKAHGGENSFGLLWDPASDVNGEGCDQCHNKTQQ